MLVVLVEDQWDEDHTVHPVLATMVHMHQVSSTPWMDTLLYTDRDPYA